MSDKEQHLVFPDLIDKIKGTKVINTKYSLIETKLYYLLNKIF